MTRTQAEQAVAAAKTAAWAAARGAWARSLFGMAQPGEAIALRELDKLDVRESAWREAEYEPGWLVEGMALLELYPYWMRSFTEDGLDSNLRTTADEIVSDAREVVSAVTGGAGVAAWAVGVSAAAVLAFFVFRALRWVFGGSR